MDETETLKKRIAFLEEQLGIYRVANGECMKQIKGLEKRLGEHVKMKEAMEEQIKDLME